MKIHTFTILLSLASIGLNASSYEAPTVQSEPVKNQPPNSAGNQEPDATGTFRPGAGTVIVAQLAKSLDTKKVKVGDPVECAVAQDLLYKGKVIIPRDAKVLGHIAESTPASKEQHQSRLGLVFEKVVLKDKRELPFQYPAVITALAPPIRETSVSTTQVSDMPVQMEKGRTSGGTAIDAVGANAKLAGANMRSSEGAISVANHGVIGMKHVDLDTSSNEMTVIVSSKGDVKLASETQMVLRVTDPPKK